MQKCLEEFRIEDSRMDDITRTIGKRGYRWMSSQKFPDKICKLVSIENQSGATSSSRSRFNEFGVDLNSGAQVVVYITYNLDDVCCNRRAQWLKESPSQSNRFTSKDRSQIEMKQLVSSASIFRRPTMTKTERTFLNFATISAFPTRSSPIS